MTTTLTLTSTSARIPLAWATFNGQRVPCTIDMEWARAFEDLTRRVGGVTAMSLTEIADIASFSALGPAWTLGYSTGFDEGPAMAALQPQDFGVDPAQHAVGATLNALQATVLGISQRFEF